MSEALIKPAMTVFEARECVDEINSNLKNTRALLLELYEREGWQALGYDSWRACVVKEFGGKENYLYKQLEAARTERNLCTIVQNSEPLPEGQLRPLTSLPPDQQREVYQRAVETAPEGKVTAKHIGKTVQAMKEEKQDITVQKDKQIDKWQNVKSEPEIIGDQFLAAYNNMAQEIMNARLMAWKTTAHMTAVKYIENLMGLVSNK